MRNNDIYMDFSFNGKRLSDFNGWIHTTSNPFRSALLPSQELKSEVIPSIGEVFVGKTLGTRKWSLDIFFDNILDQREIANWLMTEMESEFYFVGDSVKINALVENIDDLEIYAEGDVFMGQFTINFVAYDPYYYPLTDKVLEFTTFSQEIVFNNDGNRESFPVLEFELNGLQNVKFKLNNVLFEVSESKDRLVIDTIYHTCSDAEINRRRSIVGSPAQFFYNLTLKSGRNVVTLINGSVEKLTIHCNSRYI
ncbi:hypothetical protein [Clostridium perfringens]|uniref:hypothetical protein n=1 Tax=Clostridium perfringens TaxID=1502 RepID=UPI0033901D04